MPLTTKALTRTQLVGMVASLRGELSALTNAYRATQKGHPEPLDDDDIENAEALLRDTSFDLDPADEVDGGFDNSWFDIPQEGDTDGG